MTSLWMAFDPVWSPEWAWLHYATALRATLVLAVLAVAALLLRRASASVRAGIWAGALFAVLALPALRALPMSWSAHVVPPVLAAPMLSIGATMVAQSWPGALRLPWTSVAGGVWALGAVAAVGRLVWAWASLAALARGARPVPDAAWLVLLGDARAVMGVGRRVRLLQSTAVGTPMTWGTFRPTIVLPADADAWPLEHRRAVLLHELAHVSRLDCLLALAAHWTCAAWWFHPGVRWAAHRLRLERERACDERVLLAGVRPSDYAACLLRIADRAGSTGGQRSLIVAADFLWRRSQLRDRIRAILDPGAVPRSSPDRLVPAMAATAGLAFVLAVGTMRLAPHPDALWPALRSADWATRAYVAETLARFGDARSVAALHAVLRNEPHPAVPVMARFGHQLRMRSPRPAPLVWQPREWDSPPAPRSVPR